MSCQHPAGSITDHAVQEVAGSSIRYAWRGACIACQRGGVGVTAVPAGTAVERLQTLLTSELTAYLTQVAAAHA